MQDIEVVGKDTFLAVVVVDDIVGKHLVEDMHLVEHMRLVEDMHFVEDMHLEVVAVAWETLEYKLLDHY